MLTSEIHLTTAWDTRVLVAPDWVVEERARLDPATNTSATWDHYASVEKEWRRKEAAKMEKDLKFFSTLVTRKESLLNLHRSEIAGHEWVDVEGIFCQWGSLLHGL